MNRDEQTTIGAILEMTPGDKDNPAWVNGEFSATIAKLTTRQTKTGQTMFTGTMEDPDTGASIAFSAFGRNAFPPQGSVVTVGGQGISLGEYNGNLQLTLGQKATLNKTGQTATAARAATPAQHRPAAGQGSYLGVTVGMALNNAALDARELNVEELDIANHDDVGKWVWQRASVYLRVAAALEAGKLSGAGQPPEPTPAPAPPPPPPPRRVAPTSTGQAFDPDAAFDDDVPF